MHANSVVHNQGILREIDVDKILLSGLWAPVTLFVGSSLYPLNKDLPLIGSAGQWKSSSESVGRCPKSIQVFQTTLWQELTFCESLLQSISISLQIFFNDATKARKEITCQQTTFKP